MAGRKTVMTDRERIEVLLTRERPDRVPALGGTRKGTYSFF